MHVIQINNFSQDGNRFKDSCWSIILTFRYNDFMYQIYISLIIIIVFKYVILTPVIWVSSIILQAYLSRFYMYIYVEYIVGHVKICTNDYFDSNPFSAKGQIFHSPAL